MNIEVIRQRYPLPPEKIRQYIRPGVDPLIDATQLGIQLLVDRERTHLKTATTGNFSNVLTYKNREGAVSSFEIRNDVDMVLVQLQGSKSQVSWRVATGVRWDALLMQEAIQIARFEGSGVRRIAMPNPLLIQGIESSVSEDALHRYRVFVTFAALQWSEIDQLFVKDLHA